MVGMLCILQSNWCIQQIVVLLSVGLNVMWLVATRAQMLLPVSFHRLNNAVRFIYYIHNICNVMWLNTGRKIFWASFITTWYKIVSGLAGQVVLLWLCHILQSLVLSDQTTGSSLWHRGYPLHTVCCFQSGQRHNPLPIFCSHCLMTSYNLYCFKNNWDIQNITIA